MNYKMKRFERALSVESIANIHYFEFMREYHTVFDCHPFRELIYVDSGYIEVKAEGYEGALKNGQVLIHKENEYHSIICPEDNAPNVIIIGFACKAKELDRFSLSATELTAEQRKILTEVLSEGRQVFLPPYDVPNLSDMKKRSEYPYGADQMIKLKLEEFLIKLIRTTEPKCADSVAAGGETKMQEVRRYIDEHFREYIRLDDLCLRYRTNKTTLCASFKEENGMTVIGYINHLRIKESKKLLREGNYNLTQISSMVGFSTVHYFSRTFKQHEKHSPTEYMKSIKSKLLM